MNFSIIYVAYIKNGYIETLIFLKWTPHLNLYATLSDTMYYAWTGFDQEQGRKRNLQTWEKYSKWNTDGDSCEEADTWKWKMKRLMNEGEKPWLWSERQPVSYSQVPG